LLLLLPLLLLQPTFGTSRQFLIVVNHPKHPTLCVRIRQFVRGLVDGRRARAQPVINLTTISSKRA